MKPVFYLNQRTENTFRVHPAQTGDTPLPLYPDQNGSPLSDLAPGDALALAADPDQRLIVTSVDRSHITMPGSRKHYLAMVVPVTGIASLSRANVAVNEFGRSEDSQAEIITNAPASLTDSNEVIAEGSPVGSELLILRHVLVLQTGTAPRPHDKLAYSVNGTVLDLEVIGSFPLADNLWQVHCTDA